MKVHLVDGTYELFRHFFAVPSARDASGQEIGAVRGVLVSILSMIRFGATHIGVATDHVIESFRNDLYTGYKTSAGVPPELLSQFPILEEAVQSMGIVVWPMTYYEADDALASAAQRAASDARVEQVLICTPDKDLGQCVKGDRIVQVDRRRGTVRDEAGVVDKFGVPPESIPDYLALVGDSADGFPGIRGWGPKSASLVLSRYLHLEEIPKDCSQWDLPVRGALRMAESLFNSWSDALLFRDLATLRTDVPVFDSVDELRWKGARLDFASMAERLKADDLLATIKGIDSGLATTI
ncbi:MAG TPA: 5'-3' exonuclease H3TH domain-containing protein [Terriglobia bacterium]|nr:5'-3' exonuclease H3TH domain-containing protein [Terriglobia bacterium]